MIFTRIKRGAARVHILAQYKLNQLRSYRPKISWRSIEKTFLNVLVIRSVLLPLPLTAQAAAVAASPEDAGPGRLVRISPETVNALTFNTSGQNILTIASPALQPITVGESLATQEAEAAAKAAQEAAAAAAAAEAARQAQIAAEQAKAAAQIRLASAPQAESTDITGVKNIIIAAAGKYGVSADLMLRIAQCESGFNPNSHNPSGASGLFQFMYSTFANSDAARAGGSIWDARANAEAAAYKIANGGLNAWNASRACWAR